MLEASAGGTDQRNQILRQKWSWDRSVGVRGGRRCALRENVRIGPMQVVVGGSRFVKMASAEEC
jgi:hypothetical protein